MTAATQARSNNMKIGAHTPWGNADAVEEVAPGIVRVCTPGHGGYKLDAAHNRQVHVALRSKGGWYEEDVDWAIVAFTFPAVFQADLLAAHKTLKAYRPDAYFEVTGQPVPLEESHVLRERVARAQHINDFVARSAWGDWHAQVPKGFVGVFAKQESSAAECWFLVPEEEYTAARASNQTGFVIDEAKHQRWEDHA